MSKSKIEKVSPVSAPSRKIPDLVKIALFVRAGGRCEFDGCNAYLLEHHVTLTEGNFAEMAHIVAFSADGPRGKKNRPININDVANLMLLCPRCHKFIDDNPDKFTRATLEGYKKRHEDRIYHVTGLGPDQKTSIVVLKTKIGHQTVTIPFGQVLEAVTPRYPVSKEGLTIDLTQVPVESSGFLAAACDTIQNHLQSFFGPGGEVNRSNHISLFALAPIPVLAYLGSRLSNKVPLDLYQRHRDTEDWSWKRSGRPVEYVFRKIEKGTIAGGVALIVSLSGAVELQAVRSLIPNGANIYEFTLANLTPNPTFLRTRADLERFRHQYQVAIASIANAHPGIRTVDLFPAVPAPIAVLCGRELLPKIHPALRIYDHDKRNGGFIYQLTINN